MAPKRKERYRTTITLDARLHEFLMQNVGPGRRFYNLSHALDSLILDLMDQDREVLELGTLKAELEEIRFELRRLRQPPDGQKRASEPRTRLAAASGAVLPPDDSTGR